MKAAFGFASVYENLIASTTVVSRRPSQHNSVVISVIIGQNNPRLPLSYTNDSFHSAPGFTEYKHKCYLFSIYINACMYKVNKGVVVVCWQCFTILKHGLQKKLRREDEIQKEAANVTSMLRTGQRNSTMRKGLFVAVWESTDWQLDKTSFKLIQLSGTAGAQKGKFNTYQQCITSQRRYMAWAAGLKSSPHSTE